MAKFVIECPNCDKNAESKTEFFLARRLIALVATPSTCAQTSWRLGNAPIAATT